MLHFYLHVKCWQPFDWKFSSHLIVALVSTTVLTVDRRHFSFQPVPFLCVIQRPLCVALFATSLSCGV